MLSNILTHEAAFRGVRSAGITTQTNSEWGSATRQPFKIRLCWFCLWSNKGGAGCLIQVRLSTKTLEKWSTFHQATLKMRSSPCSLLWATRPGACGPAALPFAATVWPHRPYRSDFKKTYWHALNSITELWVAVKCYFSKLQKEKGQKYNTQILAQECCSLLKYYRVLGKTNNVADTNARHLTTQWVLVYFV